MSTQETRLPFPFPPLADGGFLPIVALPTLTSEAVLRVGAASFEFMGRRLRKDAALSSELVEGLSKGDAVAVLADYQRDTMVDYAKATSSMLKEMETAFESTVARFRQKADGAVEDLASQTISP